MTTATIRPTIRPTLGSFTIELLGVEYPDYFQGYGLGPSTEYTHCVYGIGDTEGEAFDDCMEQMAQSDSFDFNDMTESRISLEYGHCDDNVTAAEELGIDEDTDVPLCGPDSTFAEFPAYWHIGIKWNIREEERIERIRNLPNIQPLRYEDYQPLNRSERSGVFGTWGYARRVDGSASYGDFKDTDWPESAEAYLGTLSDDITETGDLYFYVPYATGSDYSGSTVEASNAKCIKDEFGENDWVHPVYGGYNTYAVAIGLTGLLTCDDDDTFNELCEVIEGLEDYPVIDEEALWELESENSDEAWNTWCRDDFVRALESEFEVKFEWPDDSEFRVFFEDQREKADVYWYCEGSGSGMYVDLDAVAKETSFDDIVKWAIRYEVSWCNGGENSEVYYRETDAIEKVDALRRSGNSGASYRILESESTDAE